MYRRVGEETYDPRTRKRHSLNPEEDAPSIPNDTKEIKKITYWDIVITAMSKFNKESIEAVNQMTLTEYYCLTHANHERELYNEYMVHRQAFVGREVEATKNIGTDKQPKEVWIYPQFDDFFDYEKALDNLINFNENAEQAKEEHKQQDDIAQRIAEINRRKLNK